MPNYWVAIHHPDDYDPAAVEDHAMSDAITALNEEMIAAGIRVFVGGLQPVNTARSLRRQPDGTVTTTNGPYLPTTEHVGGFWVLDAPDLDTALAWGKKAAVACKTSIEVRPFFGPRG